MSGKRAKQLRKIAKAKARTFREFRQMYKDLKHRWYNMSDAQKQELVKDF
jgi:Sec-independent protein translocase protein TatA